MTNLQQPAEANSTRQGSVTVTGVNHPPYRGRLLSLHRELVELESVTGRENAVGEFLIGYLAKHGFRTSRQTLPPHSNTPPGWDRSNILAWPNASRHTSQPSSSSLTPRLLVSAHIDTVPPFIPYSIDEGEIGLDTVIRGRGSVDTKASAAAQIIAVEELITARRVRPEDVMLLYVVGEEQGGDGMRHFSRVLNEPDYGHDSHLAGPLPAKGFKAAILGEPTDNKLAKGHKGLLICDIKAKGKAGHSGYPWLGKSANELLMRAIIKALDENLGSSERFGETTLNIGVFEGGVAGNVIAEEASASLVLRIATGPEETGHEKVKARILEILKNIDGEAFSVDWHGGYGAVPCDYDVEGKPCKETTLRQSV